MAYTLGGNVCYTPLVCDYLMSSVGRHDKKTNSLTRCYGTLDCIARADHHGPFCLGIIE